MRLPTWQLAIGIFLPVLIIFLIVTPIYYAPHRAFPTSGLAGPRPRLVVMSSDYWSYGPAFALYNTGEVLIGRGDDQGRRSFHRAMLTPAERDELLAQLNLPRLVQFAGEYPGGGCDDMIVTRLLFWLHGSDHAIVICGDPGSGPDSTPVPPAVDSVFQLVRNPAIPYAVPWSITDSTLVLYETGYSGKGRPWPETFPHPAGPMGVVRIAIPGGLASKVSAFLGSLVAGEHIALNRRRWEGSMFPRVPGEAAWQ